MMIRLQKFMAHAGICSRRRAEVYIQNGRVRVNDLVVKEPGTKINPETDLVSVDGSRVIEKPHPPIYIVLNKPRGYISSCSRKHGKIVLDLIETDRRIFPVGRLDKDSSGLLLLTDDGALHHKLSHPSNDHEKEYIVTTRDPISDHALKKMANGIVIDGTKTRRARVKKLKKNSFSITLKQGRNRQIRKMTAACSNVVTELTRIRLAHIRLGNLKPGTWRYLTADETARLPK